MNSGTCGAVKRLARGGLIRGPGTGTSDSIPAEAQLGTYIQPADTTRIMVSNGESAFPPEALQAVGTVVMDAIRAMTHIDKKPGKYASGGQVEPPPPPPVPQLTGMAGQGQRILSGRAKQLADQERQALGMADGGMVRPILGYALGGLVDDERLPQYASLDAARSDLGRMSQQARTEAYAPTAATRSMGGAPGETFNPARDSQLANASTPLTPTPGPISTFRPSLDSQSANPTGPAGAVSQLADMPSIRKLVTPQGGTLYSNGSADSDSALMARGPISAQNMSAADALSQRYAAESQAINARGAPQGAPSMMVIGQNGGFGLRDNAALRERSLAMDAQSAAEAGSRLGRAGQVLAEGAAGALRTFRDEQSQGPRLAEASRLKAETDRYAADTSLAGEKMRAAAQLAAVGARQTDPIALARLQLDAQKAAREEKTANLDQAQKERLAALEDKILNGTPEEQKKAAEQKAALMGKGPADGKGLNDTQSKALLFGSRMSAANDILDKLQASGKVFSTPGANSNGIIGGAVNLVNTKEAQQLDQAKRDFLNAVLRRESGAVISPQEFDNGEIQYFPRPGDSPEVIEQKRRNRLLATNGILAEVPNAQERLGQLTTAVSQRAGQGGAPQRTVARTGMIDGRKVVQYSDGSTEYAQ